MKKWLKIILIALAVVLLILTVGPFLVPIPRLDVVSHRELADSDSKFVEIDGFEIHYKIEGDGEPALVLLHGFGASVYSWREVTPILAEDHSVYSYDRPAFGLTERPIEWEDKNPYTLSESADQLDALMDSWDLEKAVLIGNSAGATVALQYSLKHPERILGLILVDPALGNGGGSYSKYGWLLNTPQMRRIGPLLVREISESGLETIDRAWHDPSKQPADTVPLYTKPLLVENWDVGLWLYSTSQTDTAIRDRLDEIRLPVLMVTGDDDQLIPAEFTISAAEEFPNAALVVLKNCGHVPQEDAPMTSLRQY